MEIWPAIDLRGGKCVRLQQGDYQRETVFGDDPAAMARHWVALGAQRLHLVDLDGAREGRLDNLAGIRAIVESVGVDCELGGGIRSEEAIRELLDLGLDRLVIGTLASPAGMVPADVPEVSRPAGAGDRRPRGPRGRPGWRETSAVAAAELARQFAGVALAAVIYTDIAADGMLAGPNLAALAEMLAAVDAPLLASGGVTSKEDVARLAATGVAGCIIGRALYEGTLSLPEALAAARRQAALQAVKGNIHGESMPVADLRNIAFCGHGSAGKTTLVDRLLVAAGAFNRPASVDEGTSICDFDDEEKQHKYSIEATVVHFDHGGKHFQVIDTPGYPDFIGQTIGALRAVDAAAVVVNAQSGIEVNTRRVFAEAKKAGLGRLVVLNKMDAENIDFPALLESIQEMFGKACRLLSVPLGQGADFRGVASVLSPPADTAGALVDPAELSQSLLESIIEVDEAVMERYFEGTPPTAEELPRLIQRAVASGAPIPILCVSGKTGVGLPELMDTLAVCVPTPELIARTAANAAGEQVALQADASAPLVAQVFKTRIDPFVQKINFIRVYSGTLKKDETVPATGLRKGLKLAQLFRVQANETQPIDDAGPGEIVAVIKTEDLRTGMTLGELTMPPIPFPSPMVGLAVTPKSRGDETKLSGA